VRERERERFNFNPVSKILKVFFLVAQKENNSVFNFIALNNTIEDLIFSMILVRLIKIQFYKVSNEIFLSEIAK
jgi:hypothetical protein